MKRTIIVALCLMLALCTIAPALAIGNPWVDATESEIAEAVGASFGIPEGAADVAYSLIPEEKLAEMRFTLDGMDCVARMQPTEAFADISGMYYEWEVEEPCVVAFMQGQVQRAVDEGTTIDLCQWYDAEKGLMYSLSVSAADLDGFDITAVAGAICPQAEEAQ